MDLSLKPSLMKGVIEKHIIDKAAFLIIGPPGGGKSQLVSQVAFSMKQDFYVTCPVIADPTTYSGLPMLIDNHAEFLPFGDLRKIIETDRPTVYFIDDLGQATQSVMGALMQLVGARELDGKKISDTVTILAATNRREDKAGGSAMIEPLKQRFESMVNLEVDLEDWIVWAIEADLPIEIIAFIRFRPELLMAPNPSTNLINTPSPRTVEHLSREFKRDHHPDAELPVFAGSVGIGFATEFKAFLRVFRSLPDPKKILNDPSSFHHVRERLDITMALCGAISRIVTIDTANKLFKFGERLPKDIKHMLIHDALIFNPEIKLTTNYINWAVNNQDFII